MRRHQLWKSSRATVKEHSDHEYVLVRSIHIYRAPAMSETGTCADRDQESQKELTLTELREKML